MMFELGMNTNTKLKIDRLRDLRENLGRGIYHYKDEVETLEHQLKNANDKLSYYEKQYEDDKKEIITLHQQIEKEKDAEN